MIAFIFWSQIQCLFLRKISLLIVIVYTNRSFVFILLITHMPIGVYAFEAISNHSGGCILWFIVPPTPRTVSNT